MTFWASVRLPAKVCFHQISVLGVGAAASRHSFHQLDLPCTVEQGSLREVVEGCTRVPRKAIAQGPVQDRARFRTRKSKHFHRYDIVVVSPSRD